MLCPMRPAKLCWLRFPTQGDWKGNKHPSRRVSTPVERMTRGERAISRNATKDRSFVLSNHLALRTKEPAIGPSQQLVIFCTPATAAAREQREGAVFLHSRKIPPKGTRWCVREQAEGYRRRASTKQREHQSRFDSKFCRKSARPTITQLFPER